MSAFIFVALLIVGIFAFDLIQRWWRQNEWKRRWRDRPPDE